MTERTEREKAFLDLLREGKPIVFDSDIENDLCAGISEAVADMFFNAMLEQQQRDVDLRYSQSQQQRPSWKKYPILEQYFRRIRGRAWNKNTDLVGFPARKELMRAILPKAGITTEPRPVADMGLF